FRDAQKIQQVVFALASHVIIDLLFILVIFFLVFLYEWRIGLVLVVFTPVYFFWMVRRANALSACQINRIKNATSFEQQFIAVISSIQTYKMYGKEELAALNLQLKQELFQDADKGYRTALARLAFVSGIFVVPVMLLVTYMASFAAISGRISTGEFVALVGFVSFLFPVLTSLASFSVPMKEASIAFNRLYEFHLTHAGMRKQQTHIKEFRSIRLEDVIIMGKQAKPVAERLNFFLPTTGFISVVGENGTGKTRLLQVLSKCSETYEGIIRVNEQHNLCDLSFSSWMDLVAIVPQEIVLFTGTIVENIAFDNTAISKGKITEMLTRYDLHHYFDTFPAALETIIGAGGMPVSGGQKQIIGLARALFKNPAVLLLDEVTAALDAEREKQVVELLFRLKQEILIICVSHKNETICNRSDLIIQL
ncbi:ABC transporter ATP-binding protein, partial [Flavihumibacter sp. CACIAM 22H1]|uniref:ATP-binding cassette domain-containing protein n=1 Tax=Flavihumibacter sp. CACIAM 22H1 TaxID=1812911 RepID=UPI0025BE0CC8